MKLLTVVGARPQFVKAATVSRAIVEYSDVGGASRITEVLVHTGQHFDVNMSDRFFVDLQLPAPAYHLGVGGLGHGAMTGRMLERIDDVLAEERPEAVLVYGDTNSTLAGALAAAKRHVPVAHVEAGVRSYNRRMPEEINRVLTDQLSRWLFCPTSTAVHNLRREGLETGAGVAVSMVGDVMYDAWLMYQGKTRPTASVAQLIEDLPRHYYLATVHREENTAGDEGAHRLSGIMAALDRIAETTAVVMTVHPRIRAVATQGPPRHVRLLEPVGYFDMIALLSHCAGVITDSGGLQKEAYFAGKPCLILREETEWTELVTHGCSVLAGAEPDRIIDAERRMRGRKIGAERDLYGRGVAAREIVKILAAAW